MAILRLALQSLWNRRVTALLTVLSITLSVALLLGVERVRTETRNSFANTISGTDLIVGARSGAVPLLLYSVFRIGNATNNISWQSYQDIAGHRSVDWAVPLSLGDSHRGFRVLGTTPDYFTHYRFARDRQLAFAEGEVFADVYDAVLGHDVAQSLGYQLGQEIVLAHGAGKVALVKHVNKPFRVVGILQKTGTPVDRTVHVSLAGIEAIHIDWQSGAPLPGIQVSAQAAKNMDLTPETITAVMLGLKSKISTFHVQRYINEYKQEPLLAILPGVALQELWSLMSVAEQALLVVSACVVLVGLIGMLSAILTSLNERRREMAVLRSVGARPLHVFSLIIGEAVLLTVAGVLAGIGLLYALLVLGQPLIESRFGLFIELTWFSQYELLVLGIILLAGLLVGIIPGYRAYRNSLADGLSVRL